MADQRMQLLRLLRLWCSQARLTARQFVRGYIATNNRRQHSPSTPRQRKTGQNGKTSMFIRYAKNIIASSQQNLASCVQEGHRKRETI